MRRSALALLLAALLGLVLAVAWRCISASATRIPSGRLVPVGHSSDASIATAQRIEALGRTIRSDAQRLVPLSGPAESERSRESSGAQSEPQAKDPSAVRRKDLLTVLAQSPQTLGSAGPGPAGIAETDMNPSALPQSREVSTAFAIWKDVYLDRLAGMMSGLQTLRVEEMEALAKAGILRPLEYTKDPLIVAEMEAARALDRKYNYAGSTGEPGFDGPQYYEHGKGLSFFIRVGGVSYGATEADLPQYHTCRGIYLECVREAYIQAATIARFSGWLSELHYARRMERAREWKG